MPTCALLPHVFMVGLVKRPIMEAINATVWISILETIVSVSTVTLSHYHCLKLLEINRCNYGDPCANGKCSTTVNGITPNFTCQCDDGWTGVNCDTSTFIHFSSFLSVLYFSVIDFCVPDPCQYNSTCTPKFKGYNCTCLTGLTGLNCSTSKLFSKLLYSIIKFQ